MAEITNGSEDISEIKDEVLRKLGRNLLLFQTAERRLKWFAARKQISGMVDEIREIAEATRQAAGKDTLGGALRRATDPGGLTEQEREKVEAETKANQSVHLKLSFEFTGPDGERDTSWHKPLEALLEARNDLVHHFLERFDLETREGFLAAGDHLDEQHAEYSPVVADLGRRCEQVARAGEMHAAVMRHPELRAELLHGHLRLELEETLRKVAREKARADGWTYLSLAGQELARDSPDLLKSLKKAFGHGGLREAVAAMSEWELREEPIKGGVRVLYRRRS